MARDTLPEWARSCIPWSALERGERRALERHILKRPVPLDALAGWPRSHGWLYDDVLHAFRRWNSERDSRQVPSSGGAVEAVATRGAPTATPTELAELAMHGLRSMRARTAADIDGWAYSHGIDDLMELRPGDLARELGRNAWGGWQVAVDLLAGNRETEQTVRDALVGRLTTRAMVEDALPRWRELTVSPALAPLHRALVEAVDPVHTPLRARASLTVALDPPALQDGDYWVMLEPAVDLSQASTALIWSALRWLEMPEGEASRQELIEAMARPAPERHLAALVAALQAQTAAHVEVPADGTLSAWLLKDRQDRWELVQALATPKTRGGFKVKEYHRSKHDEPALLAADERAVGRSTLVGALDELRDHPRVFVRDGRRCDGRPRAVRRVQVGLDLRAADGDTTTVGLRVGDEPLDLETLSGRERATREWLVRATDTTIDVAHLCEAVLSVAHLLRFRGPMHIPTGPTLLQQVPALTQVMEVHVGDGVLGASVTPSHRPVLRFTLAEGRLSVVARVQPLIEAPTEPVGAGRPLVVAQRDGQAVHVRRDLGAEPTHVRAVLAPLELPSHCRVDDGPDGGFCWRLHDLQQGLDVVERARGLADTVDVRWGGERPVLGQRALVASDVRLQVRAKGRDWFGLGGTVSLDGLEVALGPLLQAALEGHHWVPLSTGQWARLSDGLRAHLCAAATAGGGRRGQAEPQLQAVHAGLLQPMVDAGAELDAPAAWLDRAQRCREARDLPAGVPEGVVATLRPYQEVGITWLQRLAHWAPGAVLADDMGLGKTLQTLALLVARADRPSLVVAPTSLVHNWQREAERFTPGLGVSIYHGTSRTLDARPGQVVLTTYGVVVNDLEALQAVGFGTVVFDEAHALKNPAARRTKAAAGLEADFVVALTGTPVENRTGDLWSLFRVVVPGLLGSAAAFRERFIQPIEAGGDTTRRAALARLVGPFILRRTKGEVAKDLPPRTEIVRRVTLSSDERALYDTARLAAVARMQSATNQQRFQVFEELLRLRKLACHPKLADATSEVSSSKLRTLRRMVTDARDAGERCLVFSTFTSHLALIRTALTADGHRLRYLDGSMSPAKRLAEVDAFQSGEGDVFLISTKAGGVGLNLTAATTVFHVDPWWNPASEDQATDRAHRIGQDRPVTVVRLVSADTIEEQIVAMHATKRGLADALLAHSGSSRQVSVEELVALLADPDHAAEPEPSSPLQATVPVPVTDPRDTVHAFSAHLESLHTTGVVKTQNTVRSYRRAVEHFATWLTEHTAQTALTASEIDAHGAAFIAATKLPDFPHKSDKVYARPALSRLRDFVSDP